MTGGVTKRCDCPEAKWSKCTAHPWYLKKFRHRGILYAPNLTRHAKLVLGQDITAKTEAEVVGLAVRNAIVAGTYVSAKAFRPAPVTPPVAPDFDTAATLDAVAALYRAAARPRTETDRNLRHLCDLDVDGARLGDRAMTAVTIDDLVAYRESFEGQANSTWNKKRTMLGQVFRWARWAGHTESDVLRDSPPDLLKPLQRGKQAQRRRRISEDEWTRLLDAAAGLRVEVHATRLWGLLVALLETAARIGELLALQWRDVHLASRTLTIRAEESGAKKTGDGRTLDISPALYAVLVARQHDPAGQPYPRRAYVFGDVYGERVSDIKRAWRTVVLRAHDLEPAWTIQGDLDAAGRAALADIDLHLHDIRHEGACRWLESGAFDLAQISQRLGHASIAQTATYLHAASTSLRAAQAQYDAHQAPVVPPGPRGYKPGTNQQTARTAGRFASVPQNANLRQVK